MAMKYVRNTSQYVAYRKQVQALGKQRLADALGKGGGKEPKAKTRPYVWESILEFKAESWDEAKTKLQKVHTGIWLPDRRCPQTTSGGMVVRRFKPTDKAGGKVYLARILDLQGGSWRLQRGNVEDNDPEETDDEDEKDNGGGDDSDEEGGRDDAERRGAAPPAKRARKVAAEAPVPAPAPPVGKRERKKRKQ